MITSRKKSRAEEEVDEVFKERFAFGRFRSTRTGAEVRRLHAMRAATTILMSTNVSKERMVEVQLKLLESMSKALIEYDGQMESVTTQSKVQHLESTITKAAKKVAPYLGQKFQAILSVRRQL